MRVLFTVSPGLGHLFPAVPTAWALRTAGHDVLVSTTGPSVTAAANAGLHVYDAAPDVNIFEVFQKFSEQSGLSPDDMMKLMRDQEREALEWAAGMFGAVADVMVDRAVQLAETWRPDLVVHTLMDGVGPLIAAKLGVPSVLHGFGLSGNVEIVPALHRNMTEAYAKHGVTESVLPAAALVVAPPSMTSPDMSGWSIRYLPYNGGGALPSWLVEPAERPRVAVTLGTVIPHFVGLQPLQSVVKAAAEVDAEFILAIGDSDPASLGELPPNVRPAGWVPLNALLPTCTAVIHHGGSGSTMAGLDAGVPHLVLPSGADQFINAAEVAKRGVGLTAEAAEVDAELITRLITDQGLRQAAAEVRAELATLPTPAELVTRLEGLTTA